MSRTHGAQEAPFEQLRFCMECNKNTKHTRWDDKALWTCTEHTTVKLDVDAYKLLERRLADAEKYNTELLQRMKRYGEKAVLKERERTCAYLRVLAESYDVDESSVPGPWLVQAAVDIERELHLREKNDEEP